MKLIVRAFVPVLVLGLATPIFAAKSKTEAKAKVGITVAKEPVFVRGVGTPAVSAKSKPHDKHAVETAVSEAPLASCNAKTKEKKKSGLGGLLRAARNSGLLNVVAGRTGASAVVGSVANTAIDVATADAGALPIVPELERPKC